MTKMKELIELAKADVEYVTFRHKLVMVFGGHYVDKKNDIAYWYLGLIREWIEIKSYMIKRWFTDKYLGFKIWLTKIK